MNPLNGTMHEDVAMSHLRIFSYSALRDFLKLHNLQVEEYRAVGFYPFPLRISRILCRIMPIYGAYLTCRVRGV